MRCLLTRGKNRQIRARRSKPSFATARLLRRRYLLKPDSETKRGGQHPRVLLHEARTTISPSRTRTASGQTSSATLNRNIAQFLKAKYGWDRPSLRKALAAGCAAQRLRHRRQNRITRSPTRPQPAPCVTRTNGPASSAASKTWALAFIGANAPRTFSAGKKNPARHIRVHPAHVQVAGQPLRE